MNFINTLPCSVTIVNPFNGYQFLDSGASHTFHHIAVENSTDYNVVMEAPENCGFNHTAFSLYVHTTKIHAVEKESGVIFIGINKENALQTYVPELVDFYKSMSGKPKLRVVYLSSSKRLHDIHVRLQSTNGFQDIYFVPNKPKNHISTSAYVELTPGR